MTQDVPPDHLFGTAPPSEALHATEGSWYTQTTISPPRLDHWRRVAGRWAPATGAPVEDVSNGPGWIERLMEIVRRGHAAYLGPGSWHVPEVPADRAALEVTGLTLRVFGIPTATTIVGGVGPVPSLKVGERTRAFLRADDCGTISLHGLSFDGGVDASRWSRWNLTADLADLASIVEVRRSASLHVTWCSWTRCAGSTGNDGLADLAERWNQGTCFIRAVSEVSISDSRLDGPMWMEGVVAVDCDSVTVDRFTAIGPPEGWRLSTPLHSFGPSSRQVAIRNCRLSGHRGSALNVGASGPLEVSDCLIDGADAAGRAVGGGIDCGAEMVSLGWAPIVPARDVSIVRNRLSRIAGAAIRIGGGSPEATSEVCGLELGAEEVTASFDSPPPFVPGQAIAWAGDPTVTVPVTSVDMVRRSITWSTGRLAQSVNGPLVAPGLAGTILARRVVIAENQVTDASAGVDVRASTQIVLLRNAFTRIRAAEGHGPQGTAIQLIGVDGAVVDGNEITSPDRGVRARHGILTWECSRITIASNTFSSVDVAWLERQGPRELDSSLTFRANLIAEDVPVALRLEAKSTFPTPSVEGTFRAGRPLSAADIQRVHRSRP